MTKKFDFTSIALPTVLKQSEINDFLLKLDEDSAYYTGLSSLAMAFEHRFDSITVRKLAIDGKSTNPFVLAAYARRQSLSAVSDFDSLITAAKLFSSFETALGRLVEDVVPSFYGWTQVHSPGHSLLSEIDSCRLDTNLSVIRLAALKSGPACINDSMVAQIASAIASNWEEWADYWGVNNVHYVIGMNYSTGANSNKKDWHIVRLAEEKLRFAGRAITDSCIKTIVDAKGKQRHQALPLFVALSGGKSLTVEVKQGKAFWSLIGRKPDAVMEICAGLALSLGSPTQISGRNGLTIEGLEDLLVFSKALRSQRLSESELEWFVLFLRHFCDRLD